MLNERGQQERYSDAEIARLRRQLRTGHAEAARVAKALGVERDPRLRPTGPP
jgi:hypothetical protein